MSEISVVCTHCHKLMNVPKTFVGRFAEFRCPSCGRSFGTTPSDAQVRVLSRGAETLRQKICDQIQNLSSEIIGLPVQFRQAKEVKWAVQFHVEAVAPTGIALPLGILNFSETGKVYSEQSSPTLTSILDRLDPKDRF